MASVSGRPDLINEARCGSSPATFLAAFAGAVEERRDGATSPTRAGTRCARVLKSMSDARARQGFTPSETATFVFSLKQPLFAELARDR